MRGAEIIVATRLDWLSMERIVAPWAAEECVSKRVATMIFAPLIGYAIDLVARHDYGGEFWPIGALGAVVALGFVVTGIRRSS